VAVGVAAAPGGCGCGCVGVADTGGAGGRAFAVEVGWTAVGRHRAMPPGRDSTRRSRNRAAKPHTQVSAAAPTATTIAVLRAVREEMPFFSIISSIP
jgi:hypothetical protein